MTACRPASLASFTSSSTSGSPRRSTAPAVFRMRMTRASTGLEMTCSTSGHDGARGGDHRVDRPLVGDRRTDRPAAHGGRDERGQPQQRRRGDGQQAGAGRNAPPPPLPLEVGVDRSVHCSLRPPSRQRGCHLGRRICQEIQPTGPANRPVSPGTCSEANSAGRGTGPPDARPAALRGRDCGAVGRARIRTVGESPAPLCETFHDTAAGHALTVMFSLAFRHAVAGSRLASAMAACRAGRAASPSRPVPS